MRRAFPGLLVLLLVLSSVFAFAKGPTSRITIDGGNLKAEISITDPMLIEQFRIWAGPNPSMPGIRTDPQSLIIDWSRGTLPAPQKDLPRYRVSFYVNESGENETEEHERVVQVVFYKLDSMTGLGYVYLPGSKKDRGCPSAMIHGPEGNWFHAWDKWQKLADPLIAQTVNRRGQKNR